MSAPGDVGSLTAVRAYVTGGSGFVGTWLRRHLCESGDEVVGGDLEVDVTDPGAIAASLVGADPDVVYHLAGLAHVGRSWEDPGTTFQVNAVGTLNVLEAASSCARPPRVIVVSSAEVYGRVESASALTEASELRPISPYAASKVAAEFLGVQAHLGRGLPVIRVRPFNHVGPGQADTFVVSGLARR
ncbi:MAG: GDP-mannose 4,6-dehydratase, partial [Acidimicrobiales bacterium]